MANTREMPAGPLEAAFAVEGGDGAASLAQQMFDTGPSLIMKTELTPGLIIPLSRALTVAKMVQSEVLDWYINYVLESQISKDRKGRLELMEAMIAGRSRSMDDDDI